MASVTQLQYTAYTVPLLVAVLISVAGAVAAWTQREGQAERYAMWIQVSLGLWAVFTLLRLSTVPPAWKTRWLLLFVPTVPLLVVTSFLFVIHFTGRSEWDVPHRRFPLLAFPFLTACLSLTNGVHGLVISDTHGRGTALFAQLTYDWGPGMYLITALSAALIAVYVALTFQKFRRSRNVYRKISFVFLLAFVGVAVAFLVSLAGLSPFPPFVLAPFVWVAVGGVLVAGTTSVRVIRRLPVERALSLVSTRSHSAVPLARDFILQEIESGVIVIDADDRIVDINETAKRMLGLERPVGQRPAAVIDLDRIVSEGAIQDLLASEQPIRSIEDEIWVESARGERCYDVSISSLSDDATAGIHVAILHDITRQKKRERKLEQRESELTLLKDTMSRFLRHNIRNELNVARSRTTMLTEQLDDPDQDIEANIETIVATMDKLVERSEKARYVERIVDGSGAVTPIELTASITQIARQYETKHEDTEITVDIDSEVWARATDHIHAAIENLVENAIEHNNTHPRRVQLTATTAGEHVEVRIADNGPGLSQQEIDTVQQMKETDLQHGSGFGLWLVKWIVERSDGALAFEVDDAGTTVVLRLERAESA